MKKLLKITVLLAVTTMMIMFASCKQDVEEENNNSTSVTDGLPASVGTNELAGKTFRGINRNGITGNERVTISFSDSIMTMTYNDEHMPSSSYYTGYDHYIEWTNAYTFNSNTKRYASKALGTKFYFIINGEKIEDCRPMIYSIGLYKQTIFYKNDAEMVEKLTEFSKKLYDFDFNKTHYPFTDDLPSYTEYTITNSRLFLTGYGYSDTTGATPVPDEVFENYKKALSTKKIGFTVYNLSDTGLKIQGDKYYPAGTTLSDFNSLTSIYIDVVNNNESAWKLRRYSEKDIYPFNCYWELVDRADTNGLLISSFTESAMHVTATATREWYGSVCYPFNYTDADFDITCTKNETETGVSYVLTHDDTTYGTITLEYQTADNIPDFTDPESNYTEYELIEE